MASNNGWSDWDDDWFTVDTDDKPMTTGTDSGKQSDDEYDKNRGGNQGRGRALPVPQREDQYGVRPSPAQGPGFYQQQNNATGAYIIRGITEVPLSHYGILSKIFRGIPLYANNQINISLQESGSVGHGGGAVNGVIYGKIENYALSPGMRVKLRGKAKRDRFVIKDLYDYDNGGQPIRINPFWKDPIYEGKSCNKGGNVVSMIVLLLLVALLAGLYFFLRGGIDPDLLNKIKIVAIIIIALVFIKVFNIDIFNNFFVQKVILIVVLCAVALYVPGGDAVMICAIMIYGLYMMLKGIIR